MPVAGNRFVVPRAYAGTPVNLDVFDMAGKRVGLLRNVRGTVDLRVIGATASNSYIVRIRPAVRGEMP
jgi:hypothetical protein